MDAREYGLQLQEKFELYLLALIFTVLALAVQTAKFDNINIVAVCLELASWVVLLFSGLVGLRRMEWIPVAHFAHADQCQSEAELQQYRTLAKRGIDALPVEDQGEPASIETFIKDREQHILRMKANKRKYDKLTRKRYVVHKWTFVLGMFLLIGARGLGPSIKVYEAVVKSVSAVPPAAGAPRP
jgi:hypothetical protein